MEPGKRTGSWARNVCGRGEWFSSWPGGDPTEEVSGQGTYHTAAESLGVDFGDVDVVHHNTA